MWEVVARSACLSLPRLPGQSDVDPVVWTWCFGSLRLSGVAIDVWGSCPCAVPSPQVRGVRIRWMSSGVGRRFGRMGDGRVVAKPSRRGQGRPDTLWVRNAVITRLAWCWIPYEFVRCRSVTVAGDLLIGLQGLDLGRCRATAGNQTRSTPGSLNHRSATSCAPGPSQSPKPQPSCAISTIGANPAATSPPAPPTPSPLDGRPSPHPRPPDFPADRGSLHCPDDGRSWWSTQAWRARKPAVSMSNTRASIDKHATDRCWWRSIIRRSRLACIRGFSSTAHPMLLSSCDIDRMWVPW